MAELLVVVNFLHVLPYILQQWVCMTSTKREKNLFFEKEKKITKLIEQGHHTYKQDIIISQGIWKRISMLFTALIDKIVSQLLWI